METVSPTPGKPSETTPQSIESPQSTSVSDATKHEDEVVGHIISNSNSLIK